MSVAITIALTHVRARARQTLVAIAGVATGVGFSIMMAALLQGSQQDFIRQLVNECRTSRCRTSFASRRRSPARPSSTPPKSMG